MKVCIKIKVFNPELSHQGDICWLRKEVFWQYIDLKDFIQFLKWRSFGPLKLHRLQSFKDLGRKFKYLVKIWVLWYHNIVKNLNF